MGATDTPDRDTLIRMYELQSLIKQNDERFRSMIKAGKIGRIYYSPRGQECIPAGVSVNLRRRLHLHHLPRHPRHARQGRAAEAARGPRSPARRTGTCKGKGGPMHITHPATGVMVTTGIVGTSMPIANGLALAAQIDGDERVTVANFGDGASNIGAFHEALNLAAVWKLPVIFVCQNNRYGEHTPLRDGHRRRSGSPTAPLATRCPASRSTATIRWRCTRPRAKPSPGRAPARARR